jgi:hypothetical protein
MLGIHHSTYLWRCYNRSVEDAVEVQSRDMETAIEKAAALLHCPKKQVVARYVRTISITQVKRNGKVEDIASNTLRPYWQKRYSK